MIPLKLDELIPAQHSSMPHAGHSIAHSATNDAPLPTGRLSAQKARDGALKLVAVDHLDFEREHLHRGW